MSSHTLSPHLTMAVGRQSRSRCLCIGLDMAWFGGSEGKPDTQHDCLVSAISDQRADDVAVHIDPLRLEDRDQDAGQVFEKLSAVIERLGAGLNVVLAIDAPLQGVRAIPAGRQKVRRSCEDRLSVGRQAIDREMGGARGWHPTIQPGLPLPPRVVALVTKLENELGMRRWSPKHADHPKLIIECFPAEAIWASKRLGGYAAHTSGGAVKAYKKQQGVALSASKVEALVGGVLLDSFEHLIGVEDHWLAMVKELIAQMLKREGWCKNSLFRGGKLLDDVVDSAICLATALSYANGTAHVWHDSHNADDGHIIGPGLMQALLTRRTHLV